MGMILIHDGLCNLENVETDTDISGLQITTTFLSDELE